MPHLQDIYRQFPADVLAGIDLTLNSENLFSKSFFKTHQSPIFFDAKQSTSISNILMNEYLSYEIKCQEILDTIFKKNVLNKDFTLKGLTNKEKDLFAIIIFLNDLPAVEKQLAKIEQALVEKAGTRYDRERQALIDYQEDSYLKHNKLLSDFLKDWAIDNGSNLGLKSMKY